MTDTMFTRTALTEAAKGAGVTADQARAILEAAGVELAQEPIEPGLYLMARPTGPRPVLVDQDGSLALISDEGDMLEGLVSSAEEHKALTPARAVPVTAAPVVLTEDQVGEEWDAVTASDPEAPLWLEYPVAHRARFKAVANALLFRHAAPAEGEPIASAAKPIDVTDVREGDRVRLELENGDEATITVKRVAPDFLTSELDVFYTHEIRAVHLLHREEA